jgi:hypothetical protein
VVDALFYNFAPGEVARHIPKVWRTTTPEMIEGVGGLGAHVLFALDMGMAAEKFGHIHHLPAKPYESLEPDELDELVGTLEPLAALLLAAQD